MSPIRDYGWPFLIIIVILVFISTFICTILSKILFDRLGQQQKDQDRCQVVFPVLSIVALPVI